jgi:hypothetical protein
METFLTLSWEDGAKTIQITLNRSVMLFRYYDAIFDLVWTLLDDRGQFRKMCRNWSGCGAARAVVFWVADRYSRGRIARTIPC